MLLGNGDGTFQPQQRVSQRQAIPTALVAGDFNGDGRLDLAWRTDKLERDLGAAGQRRRHVPASPGDRWREPTRRPWWPGISTATAGSTWPWPTLRGDVRARCCWATATARSRPGRATTAGLGSSPSWRAISTATAGSTWPPPTSAPATSRCCWATATAPSSPSKCSRREDIPVALVAGDFNGDGRLDLAVANAGGGYPDGRIVPGNVSMLLGNGDGTFQAPQATHRRGTPNPGFHGGGRFQRRWPARPGRGRWRRSLLGGD